MDLKESFEIMDSWRKHGFWCRSRSDN